MSRYHSSQGHELSRGTSVPRSTHTPLTTATRTAYLLAPLAIIGVTLFFHAYHDPIPAATLSVLMTAAYGKTLWHDFLANRPLLASWSQRAIHERAETTQTTTRSIRDTQLAVQPTTH